MRLILYVRPTCPLCDEARRAMTRAELDFEEVDISDDVELEGEYGLYIPVVELDGRIVFHAGMEADSIPSIVAEESL